MKRIPKKIGILGAGESGVGAALLARSLHQEVFVSDSGSISVANKEELSQNDIRFEELTHSFFLLEECDIIIKSPGIPEDASIVKSLSAKGIPIISEIEYASWYTQVPIIAITGTNGKTTTTLLTHFLLNACGVKATLGGNIGKSFARSVAENVETECYVLELSSFQLDGCFKLSPQVSILLNITPDHLDRYENMNAYAASKIRIAEIQSTSGTFIYCEADSLTKNIVEERRSQGRIKSKIKGFSTNKKSNPYAWVENSNLCIIDSSDQIHSLDIDSLPLVGTHNLLNMSAAILAAHEFGVSMDLLHSKISSFTNAPHRLQKVRELEGVLYVNDSKATNVDAVSYALESYGERPLVWIVGGKDKGNDYSLLDASVFKNVKAIICLGKDNYKLLEYYKDKQVVIEDTHDLQTAIDKARQHSAPGDVVLLSPACASFDLFKNYEDRGEQFMNLVLSLS